MIREILFRGKRVDTGEWVFGFYYHLWNPVQGNRIPVVDESKRFDRDGDSVSLYEVDPSTIGQFTGLHDKDGNKIFEGDIFQRNSVTGIVTYHRGCWFLEWEQNGTTSRVILGDGDIASGNVIGHKITTP